ncbi:MAG: 16S rRNA (uracil(1498)-N(3))-methyltransferase [Cytophagales bacterium]|nr:16S rRNA (uracil(1498)-N(3))-methyltransferase [Cytophagales bacterium]
MNLFYQPAITNGVHHLDEVESKHAVRVLRLNVGDELQLTDGVGSFYKAKMTEADPKKCAFTIIEKEFILPRKFSIAIAMAPTKNIDRTEWFVEKAVELGIEQIHFLLCKNSERKNINLDRIEKIVISAMKQSGQAWRPKISGIKTFQEVLTLSADQKFICFVDSKNPHQLKSEVHPDKSYLVLIGPEGDFRQDELDLAVTNGYTKVGLGPNRLRTETAALAACHTLNLVNL